MSFMRIVQAVPPTDLPVSVEEAKLFLRVDHDDEDDLIESFIGSARDAVEAYLLRAVMDQEWKVWVRRLPESMMLPRPPVVSVEGVVIHGGEVSLEDFEIDPVGNRLIVKNPVWKGRIAEISYKAGDSENVPEYVKTAVQMMVAYMYENRMGEPTPVRYSAQVDDGTGLPSGVKAILRPHRVLWL